MDRIGEVGNSEGHAAEVYRADFKAGSLAAIGAKGLKIKVSSDMDLSEVSPPPRNRTSISSVS